MLRVCYQNYKDTLEEETVTGQEDVVSSTFLSAVISGRYGPAKRQSKCPEAYGVSKKPRISTESKPMKLATDPGTANLLMENIYQLALFALLELEHWF